MVSAKEVVGASIDDGFKEDAVGSRTLDGPENASGDATCEERSSELPNKSVGIQPEGELGERYEVFRFELIFPREFVGSVDVPLREVSIGFGEPLSGIMPTASLLPVAAADVAVCPAPRLCFGSVEPSSAPPIRHWSRLSSRPALQLSRLPPRPSAIAAACPACWAWAWASERVGCFANYLANWPRYSAG